MDTSSKRSGGAPHQSENAPPVARQGVSMQSNGRALHRNDDAQPKCAKRRRHKVTYWPTTRLTREQMAEAIRIADHQDEVVMAIIRHHGTDLAASQVWRIGIEGGRNWLLTSVRRSINTLCRCAALECGERLHDGPFKRPEHTWRLSRDGVTP
jgi:hypothetical protein